LALLPRVVRGARRPAEDSEGLQAGMEGVDTERVQRITYEMSKGSAHFVNEQRKQAAVTERIDKMQARAAQLTPALVGTQPALCTPPSRPFARHPAGPCLSISLRLALERPPSSVSYNNGAQLRPLRLCSHWSGAALAAGGGTTAHSAIAYDSTGDDARPVAHVAVRLPLGLAPCLPPRLSLTASLTISPTVPPRCVDMDAFFAQVEERDDPSLASRPMGVGGLGMLSTVRKATIRGMSQSIDIRELVKNCRGAASTTHALNRTGTCRYL
jgi:hypothetical protein